AFVHLVKSVCSNHGRCSGLTAKCSNDPRLGSCYPSKCGPRTAWPVRLKLCFRIGNSSKVSACGQNLCSGSGERSVMVRPGCTGLACGVRLSCCTGAVHTMWALCDA